MKKTVKIGFFILLGCILLGIGIVISIFSRQLNYEKLLKAGYKNYEVDITYTADEEDGFSFWGNYIYETNELSLEDDDGIIYNLQGNIYDLLVTKMENKKYENETTFSTNIDFQEICSKEQDFELLLKDQGSMVCEYEIDDNKIYDISCEKDEKSITFSFDFKD